MWRLDASDQVMLAGCSYQAMREASEQVRQYFGTLRLDRSEQIVAGNLLVEQMWVYYDLFQPVMHLTAKTVTGDKVRRGFEESKTAFERLLATGVLSQEQQHRLQALYEQTNLCNCECHL